MSKFPRSAVQKYHDRVAPRYDDSYNDLFWQWHDRLTWDYLKPYLPRDHSASVVDLGCGTGKWAAKLAKSGYATTCVDISNRMLDRARSRMEKQGASQRCTFIQADLMNLSALPRDGYALAVAMGDPIGCCESPARAMKQIRRILCEGGVLAATFDNRWAGLDYYLERGDPGVLRRFLRDGKTHWLTKDKQEQFAIFTFAPLHLVKLVEATGFTMLDLVGKTVLPMRHYRGLLETPHARRTWAAIEKRLCRDLAAMGRASHLQVACAPCK